VIAPAPAERLATLRAAGAEVFDAPGFGLAASLLARAEALGGGAGALLVERARLRLDALEASLREGRAAAERALGALVEDGAVVAPELRAALSRGEVTRVRREARRVLRERARERQRVQIPWVTRLRGEALSRGATASADAPVDLEGLGGADGTVERGAHGRAVALGDALSSSLLRQSAESARATLAVARAADNLPEAAGPYNAQVLVARTLTALAELSPAYVRALVAAADDLAALEAALAPEAQKVKQAKPKAAKRRRAAAG
jgi:hypothetical protein